MKECKRATPPPLAKEPVENAAGPESIRMVFKICIDRNSEPFVIGPLGCQGADGTNEERMFVTLRSQEASFYLPIAAGDAGAVITNAIDAKLEIYPDSTLYCTRYRIELLREFFSNEPVKGLVFEIILKSRDAMFEIVTTPETDVDQFRKVFAGLLLEA